MIPIVKGFSVVSEAEVDVFLEFLCSLYDPVNAGSLVSGSFAFSKSSLYIWKFMVHILPKAVLVVNNLPANGSDPGDVSLISGLGRSPRGGHGNPLQYFCVENPMDRGDWQSKVHGVTESDLVEVTSHECKA